MQIHREAVEIVIQTPAKLNLFFEVLGKRSDGYHEIETLMCPIDWCDTLCFRETSGEDLELECRWGLVAGLGSPLREGGRAGDGSGFEEVPLDGKNLVWRAVDLVRRRTETKRGARLRLIKRIPTAAGLGGGSSDAAAALVAANLGWNLRLSLSELSALAAELGSDVPFFLHRGPAICRGRGERIEPAIGLGRLNFVVVRPPEGLATVAVYRACRAAASPRALAPLLDALRQGNIRQAGGQLFNRLQTAAERLSPWVERLNRLFAGENCLGHGMSGSGTAYFGLFRTALEARRVARRFRSRGVGCVVAVRSCG
jgi:4-diphosphocytidyl-2-C-methyl-D-erythritol kinase